MTTRIEVHGRNYEFCVSELPRVQWENWDENGFPDTDSNDYGEYLELRENTYESGLIPDTELTLYVNWERIDDLHKKIDSAKNFILSSHLYKFRKGKFYLVTTSSHSASYSLTIDEDFDFKKLRWKVLSLTVSGCDSQDLLTIEYGDTMLDYERGGGTIIMSEYLVKV
jgi:hypothetical protein